MARSRLYRSRFLQVNICWKALGEIYKIYILLHRSDIDMSANFERLVLGCIEATFCKRILNISNYSMESSWRDLQDLHTFAPLRPSHFNTRSCIFSIIPWFPCFSLFYHSTLVKSYRNVAFSLSLKHDVCVIFTKLRHELSKHSIETRNVPETSVIVNLRV